VAHQSEPRYPVMIDKSPFCNGLLTMDCAFWKERVISNRLYHGEGRSHRVATKTLAESALFALQTGLVFYRNVCAGQVFPIERNTFEARATASGMTSGVIIKLPYYVWRHTGNGLLECQANPPCPSTHMSLATCHVATCWVDQLPLQWPGDQVTIWIQCIIFQGYTLI